MKIYANENGSKLSVQFNKRSSSRMQTIILQGEMLNKGELPLIELVSFLSQGRKEQANKFLDEYAKSKGWKSIGILRLAMKV